MVDFSFQNSRTLADYIGANQDRAIKEQISQAELAKARKVDIDELGQIAFVKAAQGIPLTPQEQGAMQYLDAKSALPVFNPVTGVKENRESISSRMGLSPQAGISEPVYTGNPSNAVKPSTSPPPLLPDVAPQNEWDVKYQQQLSAAAGNPKLQQAIKAEYLKSKVSPTLDQSKSANYSDRMINANPDIDDQQAEANTLFNHFAAGVPGIGNFLVPEGYQQFDRAQRDIINAQLRAESGAVISPTEFSSARAQYIPAPGDKPDVLAEKKLARENAQKNMQREAGPAYTPRLSEKTSDSFYKKKLDTNNPRIIEALKHYSAKEIYDKLNGKQ